MLNGIHYSAGVVLSFRMREEAEFAENGAEAIAPYQALPFTGRTVQYLAEVQPVLPDDANPQV